MIIPQGWKDGQVSPPGDLVISAYQPKGLFAQVLLEPEPTLVDSLTYDITAWSLIHAYGLEGYAIEQRIDHNSASLETSYDTEELYDKYVPKGLDCHFIVCVNGDGAEFLGRRYEQSGLFISDKGFAVGGF